MQVRVLTQDITRFETPCIVVNLFEGVTSPGGATGAVDRALDGMITRADRHPAISAASGAN